MLYNIGEDFMKKINLFLVYFISFLYMEILYKVFMYESIFRVSLINTLLFLIPFSLFIYLISRLMKEKGNKIVFIIIMSVIALWFSAEYVVKDYFDFYTLHYALNFRMRQCCTPGYT